MKFRSALPVALIALCAVLLFLGGCAATSAPFQAGAAADGPLLATDTAAYLRADTSLSDLDRSTKLAQVDQLSSLTSAQSAIDLASVETAWASVRPLYVAYVTGDTKITDVDRQIRLRTASKFDDLIAAEHARHSAFLAP